MQNSEIAKKILADISYITLASVCADGTPWNSPLFSAYDENYNFFWASWKENIHSKNIRLHADVFFVVYDSTVPRGTGEAVYVKAMAYELNEAEEVERALKYFYARMNKPPKLAAEFLGEQPRRIYKAVPEKFWLNIGHRITANNSVDKRVEVSLL